MSETDIILYGTLWLGPLLLAAVVGFYLWSMYGRSVPPPTEAQKAAAAQQRREAEERASQGVASHQPPPQRPADANLER